MFFIRKANLVPWYLLFLLILRHWEARRVPRRHSISSKTWCHGLSLISNNPHTRCEHLCIIFSASAPSGPNLFSITGIKVMTSGIAFDRPDRLSRLRAFPCMWSLQNLHDHPDRPDRTQLYPSDRGRLIRPGRLRSSGSCFHSLALDNIEWSQIGHLMNFTQRIISMMERDRNVEWG